MLGRVESGCFLSSVAPTVKGCYLEIYYFNYSRLGRIKKTLGIAEYAEDSCSLLSL